ncbi:glyoxalase [Paractinoplanes deccanensis]|uniref:Glyoxalase n=1 Tax=Paractinoplanes deccanensis TaxID=113561 RepID=A0ABQ3Y3Q9_9ACTN|nr:VOC family protein [Actinoplanes deccanensis]GID74636.1 glyoxalase [Actinoplanes deccanensis]
MGVQRIESVAYGVDDLETCVRFFDDLGLALAERDDTHAVFETPVGQTLQLRAPDDPSLPPAVEPGNTLREVVWAVDTEQELAGMLDRLRADREVTRDARGVWHARDLTGYGVGLVVAPPSAYEPPAPRAANTMGRVSRWNQGLSSVGRVRPLRMCHVALNIPKAGRREAVAFYVERLGFIPTDVVEPMGVFMRVEGDADQHNFLLCHRPDRASVNHVSFEVPGFDHVIEGGNYMISQGWQEARKLGRHTVGSNVFRFVHAPCGGRVELAADMDRVDDSYGTRVHETAPPHHIWTLRSSRTEGEKP